MGSMCDLLKCAKTYSLNKANFLYIYSTSFKVNILQDNLYSSAHPELLDSFFVIE